MNRLERLETDPDSERKLEVCPNPCCGSSFVYPTDWSEVGYTHYRLWLRCPECEYTEDGIFHADQVERFEDVLDEGRLELLRYGAKLEMESIARDVETFARAMQDDLFGPDDFGSSR